ncbi:hypothetical protein AMAG_13684 [Allomyces macrogynus ATCC 38327]|uniref:NodB homology domain-containing protein n=1 Tax=Allomyces macrogynus (strain ATCC 38327) TaxID=578462 RepID=A0A0L0T3L6_ALLM3|nr:hypothetical protein AMAG_13684 [Allomyces macrogynus ATCC 38327]|eukprot:KNE69306.1 hypothetical protein AMAG_13684 [Allomyces macrogynus ATCC 38327]
MALTNAISRGTLALIVALIAIYYAMTDPEAEKARARQVARRSPVAYAPPPSQCQRSGHIALTFDNGLSVEHTSALLDQLKRSKIKATFHIDPATIGKDDVADTVLRRIYAEGHILGLNWPLPGTDPRTLTETQLRRLLAAGSTRIYNAVGVHPRFLRLPQGQLNSQVEQVVDGMGFRTTYWNLDTHADRLCKDPAAVPAVVDAIHAPLDEFKSAGNLLGTFITRFTDKCPVAPAVGQAAHMMSAFGYAIVHLDECVGMAVRYRSSADSLEIGSAPLPTNTAALRPKVS